MKARTIVNDIYEVGIRDWTLHDFHGFATPRGVTYNSFLLMDEKMCLIDGVKAPFAEEQLCNIRTIVDPAKIDYIVVNHVEPDHSGSLPALAAGAPVFIDEFSICDASGNGIVDYGSAAAWRALIQRHGLSYMAWSLSNRDESAALIRADCNKTSDWGDGDITDTGLWVRDALRADAFADR